MKYASNVSLNNELVYIKSAEVKELPLISHMHLDE